MSEAAGGMSTSGAVRSHWRMQRKIVARGRLRLGLWGIAALPVALTAVALGWNKGPGLWSDVLDLTLRFLVPFSPALAMAGLVGEEVERQTATFVFSRPAPRWTLVVGRLLAVAPTILATLTASLVMSYALSMSRGDLRDVSDTWLGLARAMFAVALAVPAYGLVAAAIGAWLPRQPMVTVGVWILGVEVGLGTMQSPIANLSIAHHLRAIAGLPADLGIVQAAIGVVALIAASGMAIAAISRLLDRIELHKTEELDREGRCQVARRFAAGFPDGRRRAAGCSPNRCQE